ncbi:response regulator transcription factor [Phormidium sp. FACHB-592]|uniref:Response regulator transcription factor n=1 Tax=Stenomitos frigidus AS-A4 TaxID=2933935 RepID=A0ABV0KPT5_9CYAN|nr:response regulator transcription factor [Phormidium sp. FACHB-592]MBD2033502.1 response regulator transcription factor [Leptolyngbya sp. FACHB-321]MBD2074252.1 response regulator transcription factor [Phormidium sp. FACHB-592]
MEQTTAIRVLLVDDHAIVQQGLAVIINKQADMTVVGKAKSGIEAINLFRQLQPDITLMDLRMPEMDGVEAITAICAEFNTARIIVLTTYDSDEDIYRGLRAGAKGYLLKDCKPNELRTAIRTVHNGQQYIPPNVGAKLAQRMSHPELTDRELEILQLIAQGMSNLEIGAALHITENTVKSNVNRILSKLGAKDRTQATIIALKRGIANL